MAAGDTIQITDNGDGTFTVQMSEATPDPDDPQGGDQPQTVDSVDAVLQVVQQELGEDSGSPQDMWAEESKKRGASAGGGGGAPSMSM